MIGSLSYEDMLKLSSNLTNSSENIKKILSSYNSEKLNSIMEFCDSVDKYARFLNSTVQLYKDSEEALKFIYEKNKK